ncbi:MAG: IS4 family transposase [Bacteroidia bacterium]
MKDNQEALLAQFSEFFEVHLSRLKCLTGIVLCLIQVRTVNLKELAFSLNASVSVDSNYKRLQRFFRLFSFPFDALSRFIWALFTADSKVVVLSLDRTNWKLGRTNINILMLSVCYRGIGIPLMWTVLKDKRGNSSMQERIDLMKRFIKLFGKEQQVCLTADREFIGKTWLEWLDSQGIHYVIRIRKNQFVSYRGKEIQSWRLFNRPDPKFLRKPRSLDGLAVYMCGKKLEDGDFLILISNKSIKNGLFLYARRWEIETLFGALKTRGFRFETTHLRIPQRINSLTAVLALALAWAVKVGDFKTNGGKTIPIKKHGRRAISMFRIGLDAIRRNILNFRPLNELTNVLSCT